MISYGSIHEHCRTTYYTHDHRFFRPRWVTIPNREFPDLLKSELGVEADDALVGDQPDTSALPVTLRRSLGELLPEYSIEARTCSVRCVTSADA